MTKTRCLAELCSQVESSLAKSSLERSFPSTHMATTLALGGSLARMAWASLKRAWSICPWVGFWGSFSSGSSTRVSLQ